MKVVFVLFFSLIANLISSQTIDIQITNIKNQKGRLCLAIIENQKDFQSEKFLVRYYYSKKLVINGQFNLKLSVPAGKLGVSVLDDENENGKMEYGFIGIPTKGFGFSNYYLRGFKKPVFDDFCFKIAKDEIKSVVIKMKYF
jgi:uncharacterized protein (DUF2141 family)